MADDLFSPAIERLMELDSAMYQQRVLALFTSGRATRKQWLAMAAAVLHVSMSAEGAMVACIDASVLGEALAPAHEQPPVADAGGA